MYVLCRMDQTLKIKQAILLGSSAASFPIYACRKRLLGLLNMKLFLRVCPLCHFDFKSFRSSWGLAFASRPPEHPWSTECF